MTDTRCPTGNQAYAGLLDWLTLKEAEAPLGPPTVSHHDTGGLHVYMLCVDLTRAQGFVFRPHEGEMRPSNISSASLQGRDAEALPTLLTQSDPAFCNHSLYLSELIMPYGGGKKKKSKVN